MALQFDETFKERKRVVNDVKFKLHELPMTPVRPSPALQWTNLNFGRVSGITHKVIINHLYIALSSKG